MWCNKSSTYRRIVVHHLLRNIQVKLKVILKGESMIQELPWSGRHNPFIPEVMESNTGCPNNHSDSSLEAFKYGSYRMEYEL